MSYDEPKLPADGFTYIGDQVTITAPVAPYPDDPYIITFGVVAADVPAGHTVDDVEVFRNGARVPACDNQGSGQAIPSPCVENRQTYPSGDIAITVLTVAASTWDFGVTTEPSDPPPSPDPSDPPPAADTTPPTVTAPDIDFARLKLGRTARPIPLLAHFSATDPSGITDTTLQHRIGTGAFVDVPLASARAVSAIVRVSNDRRTTNRFRSAATDGASPPNTSPFAVAPVARVLVRQDGSRKIVRRGPWVRRWSRAYFGRSVMATARRGARQRLTATGSDFAIVSTKGPNRGKARVIVDGVGVATIDLFARRTKPRRVVFTTSFPSAGRHTITFKALGRKNPRSRGRRVDLDAFIVLVRP